MKKLSLLLSFLVISLIIIAQTTKDSTKIIKYDSVSVREISDFYVAKQITSYNMSMQWHKEAIRIRKLKLSKQ